MTSVHDPGSGAAGGDLARFRQQFYASLSRRADALFELTEAILCAQGPVTSLVGLSLAAVHRRGHGALYDAVNAGRITVGSLRQALAGVTLPRAADGGLVLAVDVSNWLRPDAETAAERGFCFVHGRGNSPGHTVPGWPYSFIAALEPGRSSWITPLDAVRLRPDDDVSMVTAAQIRGLIDRLIEAGQWQPGQPAITIVCDAGYDLTRLAWLLQDLPITVLGRLRSDRVYHGPPPPADDSRRGGRPARHGQALHLNQPDTHPHPQVSTTTATPQRGTVQAHAFDRQHQKLRSRDAWSRHHRQGRPLPVIEGTLIQLTAEHPSAGWRTTTMWLWASATGLDATAVDRCWQTYLRRFDIEHLFRFMKQTLGWTTPRLRTPEAADRWTWLIITAYTQLWLARTHTRDLRHRWERPPQQPERLSPNRVRRAFRSLRTTLPQPASAPKPSRPGPGRPPGTPNRHPAPHYPAGQTTRHKPAASHTGATG